MKIGRTALGAFVALSISSSPVLAQAASGAVARSGANVESTEEFTSGGFLIPLVVIVGLVIGILLIADGDDSPTSP